MQQLEEAGQAPKKLKTRGNWLVRISYIAFLFMVFIAIFADVLANDKPIYCKWNGTTIWPVFKSVSVEWGLSNWDPELIHADWQKLSYESVVWPLIPYSTETYDVINANKSPFESQHISSPKFRHWLGTNEIGVDVAAGIIGGTRIALTVGCLTMFIASIIGIILGGLAGYFGDHVLKIPLIRILFISIGSFFAFFWGFLSRGYAYLEGRFLLQLFISMIIFFSVIACFYGVSRLLEKIPPMQQKISLPFDLLVMRVIEIFNSIPGLLFLMALVSVVDQPSIFTISLILGFLSWPGIARFIRAELLKIRAQNFMDAGRALGFSHFRLLFRHALPNAIGPVLVAIAFGMAGAVLLEASLSFLGIGLSPEVVTWGRMLNEARSNTASWWLALFPGVAIFVTITVFNLLGDEMARQMKGK